MVTVNVKSTTGDVDTIKELIIEGLKEEKKRIEFALERTASIVKAYEEKYGISTSVFIEKFKQSEIEENDDTFDWWAEVKMANELREKINTIANIEICR
ncbi:MAG TPA: hypothetical protein ACFYEK_03430 [Candidatus Wunengus sp. YC60]|uniref:hypothetical protein n=1 Tax=Candidatus Wunengus sp. YC60 TaxID=3367697 RepID=UPI004028FCF6